MRLTLPSHLSGGSALSKYSFHRDGRTFLKRLRNVLGVPGDVRSNIAGPAVYGDVRLTTEAFEVFLLTDSLSDQPAEIKILYRTVTSPGTGPNQWTTLKKVEADPDKFLTQLKGL